MNIDVRHGDCLEVLRTMPDNSVDAIATDPPYGLSNMKPERIAQALTEWVRGDDALVPEGRGFMGKAWDGFVPPPAVWKECMRVLKPGGHMAVFAGARTQDLMGLSIRLAGFEIRDTLGWVYGSGFPKSMDISKAIDKRPGVHHHREFAAHLKEKREAAGLSRQDVSERVVGTRSGACWNWEHHQFPRYEWWPALRDLLDLDEDRWGRIIAEADREVVGKNKWTNSANHFVPGEDHTERVHTDLTAPASDAAKRWDGWGTALKPAIEPIILARKPLEGTVAANVLAHGVGGLNVDATRVPGGPRTTHKDGNYTGSQANKAAYQPLGEGHYSEQPAGRFPANVLLDEHAAQEMDEQSGASRFFPVFKYQAKAPKRERPVVEREDGTKIQHPTVKPLALLDWLVTLITPSDGIVLDPFAGTGTTLQAAAQKGFNSIGIEQSAEYVELISQRLADAGPKGAA